MWKILLFYCLFLVGYLVTVEDQYVRIPLLRQKTIREHLPSMKNLKHGNFDFGWLLKPHKHNSTNDSIALFRYLDSEFYGKVQIGQKAQTFNMVFDTSWHKSWVISIDCNLTVSIGCGPHNKYDHSISFTYRPNGQKYIANQGPYNLTGYFSYDTFLLGHTRVNDQLFIEMTDVPPSYNVSKSDGIIGLGLKVNEYDPIFYSMLKNKSISRPLFSIYLNRDRQSNRGGNIILGFIDKKHIHQKQVPNSNHTVPEEITYLPVNSENGYWGFNMDRVTINNREKNRTVSLCLNGCKAIVDTSTTVIMAPPSDVERINNEIGADKTVLGRHILNCDKLKKLPPIDFILDNKIFTLKGVHYSQTLTVGLGRICVSAFVKSDIPSEQNMWILGGAFLSHFYSIYDIENKKIGFVTAA